MSESRVPDALVPDLDPGLPPLRLGVVAARPVAVGPAGEALEAEIDEACRRLREEHGGKPPAAIPGLQPARSLYRAFGIDPTRTRPSSEALLRRVLQDRPPPRILNAVDLINLLALRFLLSIGLYDAGRLRGRVVLRRGRPGEAYVGIRKEEVHLEGRPVLCDEEGPFGNPTSDSLRTSVTPGTESLYMVIFAPPDLSRRTLEDHLQASRAAIERHLGAAGAPVISSGAIG